VAQEHIRQIIQSIPPNSPLRHRLEGGAHGSGIRQPWMDAMRREGVKRAFVRTEFPLRGRRTADDVKVVRTLYFSEYDNDCSQIGDPGLLGRFHASGLEEDIRTAAVQRAVQGHVQVVDGPVTATRGAGSFEFMDDEWLPSFSFVSPASDRPLSPFLQAVSLGDMTYAKELLHRGLDPGTRNAGMWRALAGDQSCVVTVLLAAGVSPNLRDQDGVALLMAAARLRALRSAEALLEAGADPNATANFGKTALSFASGDEEMVRLLRRHGARE
jgi:hypothetical protein